MPHSYYQVAVMVILFLSCSPSKEISYGVVGMDLGNAHSCLFTDTVVDCWGGNLSGESNDVFISPQEISLGAYHSCALSIDGTISCWGNNASGQTDTVGKVYSSLSCGGNQCCGISGEELFCWGGGDNNLVFQDPVRSVAVGSGHVCILTSQGSISCRGNDIFGVSSPPSGSFIQISSGDYHACAIAQGGTISCWGDNQYEQSIPPPGNFIKLSMGSFHGCGVLENGEGMCWGWNQHGQASPPDRIWQTISSGGYHSCGIVQEGWVECWGQDSVGQLDIPIEYQVVQSVGQQDN